MRAPTSAHRRGARSDRPDGLPFASPKSPRLSISCLHNDAMPTRIKAQWRIAALIAVTQALFAQMAPTESVASKDPAREQFVAAMQRIRLHQADIPDPPELERYAIHDYLIAARLRRDLSSSTDDSLDSTIDAFVRSRAGQPVSRGLRRDWLASLAAR